ASIDRALQEGWSIILEGVHIVPGLLPLYVDGALVCPFVLSIEDETAHAQHFFTRGGGRRPLASYLDHFGEIRRLQKFIVRRAGRESVPVIENESAERTANDVIELVVAAAEQFEARV